MESMRGFGLYAAVILFVCGLSATQAVERFGQWSLEQPEDFIFALSRMAFLSGRGFSASSAVAERYCRRLPDSHQGERTPP
jgi:hypothetical protein